MSSTTTDYPYEKELHTCITVAIEAGLIALEYCTNRTKAEQEQQHQTSTEALIKSINANALLLGIEKKMDDSPVTNFDKKLDAHIKQRLESTFGDDILVVGEESSASIESTQRLEHGKVFFVDPIDGTKEFINNNGEWCVMIGLNVDGTPELGVVYIASSDQLFYASRNRGTFLIEQASRQQIHDGACPSLTREKLEKISKQLFCNKLADCSHMVCLRSRSHDEEEISQVMRELGTDRWTTSGSFGIKCALIAMGKADLYVNACKKTHYWDSCAPGIIAREAGAVIVDMDGQELSYTGVPSETVHEVVMFTTLATCKEKVMHAVQKVYANRR